MDFINKYNSFSQLKKNVFSGSVLTGIDIIVTMVSYPIYLRYLGAEKYGLWSVVSVILVFSQIGQLGIGTAVAKYVAGEYKKKDLNVITEYLITSIYLSIVPSLVIIGTLVLFKTQITGFIISKEYCISDVERFVVFVGLLSVFSFFSDIIKNVVIGIGRMDIANSVFLCSRISQIILAVCLLKLGTGIWSLYFGFLLYYVLSTAILVLILNNIYHIKVFNLLAFRKQKMKDLIGFGGTLTIGTIARMAVVPFNKIIISKYIGLSEVAYYQIAYQVVNAVRNLFVKGLWAIMPKISEIYTNTVSPLKPVLSIHRKGMQFVLFYAFPIFLILFVFANPILKLWLGEDFNMQIAFALKILLIGWFINLLAVPDYFMFMGIGKAKFSVTETCIKSITNITAILTLIFLNIHFTLTIVVVIESISLVLAVFFLKYKYLKLRKAGFAGRMIYN